MGTRRELVSMEFQTTDDIRLEMASADHWRLVNPRLHGEVKLARARLVLEKAETVVMPEDPRRLDPPTLLEFGEYVAKKLNLRITHRRFRQL